MQIKTIAGAAAVVPLASAIGLPQRRGRGWCASAPTDGVLDSIARLQTTEAEQAAVATSTLLEASIVVPVYMHAVVNSSVDASFLGEATMQSQLDVMNDAFAPHDIQFALGGTTREVSDALAPGPYGDADYAALDDYWRASHAGGYDTVNLWFYSDFPGDVFGACTLPEADYPASLYYQDGCHIASGTVPGGEIDQYNLGYTSVHEVGHWLGLLHTFEGYSCSGEGDMVSDTPQEQTATSGCPTSKDSCPNVAGEDPIHNYMDYGSDPCYEEFTAGQQTRMHNSWSTYREGKSA